jgi:hypothetical protein
MSILATLLLWSACGQASIANGPDPDNEVAFGPDTGLPLRLADSLPAQQQPAPLDNAPVEKAGRRQEDFERNRDDSLLVNFGLKARFSIPFGAADRSYYSYYNTYYVDHYYSWGDFFNPGWGLEAEADFFFGKNGPGHRRSPGFNYGLAVIVQVDEYYGRNIGGDFGNDLRLDDMSATTLMIGGRVLQTLGNDFYYGGLISLGAVHYTEVEGTFTGPLFPLTGQRDKILRDTYTFASNFAFNGGYRLGPIGLTLGGALRIMAPPSEGPHFSMNSGAFWTFDINLGVEIGF